MPLVAGSSASIVTVIGGSSSDVGSGVAGVEVRVDGGEWVAADGAEAWSFPLVVTNGFYEVEVRATDLVGNVGPISDPVIIEVDGVGPELTVELPDGPTGLDRDEDTGRLLFGLGGDVEDVGSGLAFDTVVQVQVVPAGSAVSPDGWQAAVYSPWSYFAGTWSMTYGFDADITELSGDFDVWVSVADVVGNESIVDVGTVDIDAAGPDVAAGDIPNIVTGSAILTGQVSDVGTAGTASVEVTLRTFDDVVAGVTPGNGWLAADVDAVSGDWTVAVPAGLEDLYQLDLRAIDTVGNVTVETDVWRGIVDNRAPRLVATVVLTDPGDLRGTRLEYAAQCVAEDRFLEASSFDCAGSPYDEAERTFGADEDLEALFPGLVSVLRLESRFNTWVLRSSTPSARLRACDLFGNCSDSADVTPSAMVSSAWSRTAGRVRTSLATVAELSTVAGVPTVVVVTSPAEGAQVAGVVRVAFEATSADDLDRIEILIDDVVVATTDLTGSTETQYEASLAIPSVAEGTRTVVARVTTSTGEVVVSDPVEFVRDSIAPTVTIDEVDLTDENSWAEGTDMFVLTGTVTDAVSVAAVQIRIGDGVWSDASFENGVWEIAVHIPNADGQTVEVTARAVDFAGNVSTVNTSGTVDLAPSVGYQRPETTIEGCDGCSAGDQEVTFQLAGVDGDNPVAAFSCRLDDFAAVSCQSPWTIDTSSVGSHTVTVAAIDTAGLTDLSPATYTWTVVQNGPQAVLSTTPDAETDARTATFEFSASEEATFECALDGGAFTACTSPWTSNSLAYGSHLFQVRATASSVTGTAQRFSWVITNEVPVVWDSQVRVFTGSEGGTVTLNASDADPLTYRIIDAPANGTLTGEAPDLVYVANDGFTGSDSFTFVADDGQATSSVATVDVLVTTGAVPPVIVLPSGLEDGTLTVATDPGRAYATVTFEVTATDSDSLAGLSDISAKDVARILSGDPAAVDVTCDPASGSQFSIGETTVSCSATDIDDNTTIEDFVVDVVDEEPPVLSSPGNQTVTPTSADAAVEFTIPTATDNSGEAPVVACTPSSGSVLPIGDTTVSCTATDGSGNQASVSFTVTVEFDETPPVFGSVVDQTFFPDRPGVDAVSYS
ncbi:MAG: HYR domain-containing protein, partial [Ilumatobacteraceae bacterium]